MRPRPDPAAPGQESVWAYPRPAVAERCPAHITILHDGILVAETRAAIRTLETSHPPSYYIPPSDIRPGVLVPTGQRSLCEWKAQAVYWDVLVGVHRLPCAGWSYPAPTAPFAMLAGHVAFYAAPFDRCTVDGEVAVPQPGGFYGGWITKTLAGPFKGVSGSRLW